MLIREHFEIHLIMNIERIKLRRLEVVLTPLSSRGVSCIYLYQKHISRRDFARQPCCMAGTVVVGPFINKYTLQPIG